MRTCGGIRGRPSGVSLPGLFSAPSPTPILPKSCNRLPWQRRPRDLTSSSFSLAAVSHELAVPLRSRVFDPRRVGRHGDPGAAAGARDQLGNVVVEAVRLVGPYRRAASSADSTAAHSAADATTTSGETRHAAGGAASSASRPRWTLSSVGGKVEGDRTAAGASERLCQLFGFEKNGGAVPGARPSGTLSSIKNPNDTPRLIDADGPTWSSDWVLIRE